MRIVHVSDAYLPHVGGIELHLRDLAGAQRARGDDARVLTTTPPGDDADPPWVRRVRRGEVTRALRDLAPDVVHAHASVVSPVALGAARRAARGCLPTLVTVHSMWGVLPPVPRVASGLCGLADWPVAWSAVSGPAAASVRQVLGRDARVHVLPNAVDPALWRPPDPTPEAPTYPPAPTVISVMRLTRTKRAVPLVRLLARVDDRLPSDLPWRAVVVGSGPDGAAVRREVRRWGLQGRVQLTGALPRLEVRRRLEEATVFLAPAERESFGIAALEARTAGLPVVASSHGGVGEFVEHGVEGFLAPDDAGMARAVAALLGDESLRERIGAHNRAVAPRCTWDVTYERSAALYREAAAVLAARGRRPSTLLA